MKIILEVGDKVKLKEKYKNEMWHYEIRKLAGQYVTIRSLSNELCNAIGYYLEETKGMECDSVWCIQDFDLDINV